MAACGIPRARLVSLLALSLLGLSGCATRTVLGGDPQLSVLPSGELPAPDRMDLTGGTQPYFIGPYDRLTIDVYGMQELSARDVQVDASGRISFPLAGILDVSGLTPAEVEEVLARRLRQAFVRDPQVTVNLKETVSRVVTIEGEVHRPGLYPVIGRMTLLRTIAKAEGTSEFTSLEDVVIFRTVKGQRYAALFDVAAIRRGAYADPEVFANDVITVGDSRSRRLFRDILAVVPAAITPLVIALDRISKK